MFTTAFFTELLKTIANKKERSNKFYLMIMVDDGDLSSGESDLI
jgi:hypothetical protein